ncbi:MAG: sugar phosphate isomerase/epimerase [Spirochaetes bacterium]|nr:sugar phosphate isomerase/epimerase [Spirochaetota bacterium]
MMKYSVCNELFGDLPLVKACAIARRTGFSGIEFAPYTLFGDFSQGAVHTGLSGMRKVLEGEGLSFAGFHWLMARPEGLHFAALDASQRRRSRDHLARLIEMTGELGGGDLVLGSPQQRSGFSGRSAVEAKACLLETLAELSPLAGDSGASILIEQLSPDQTDVIMTMEEAARAVDQIGSPSVRSMFDFHNASSEVSPWQALIKKYLPYIGHVHVNEIDGRAPGTGNSDYGPAWKALRAGGYSGWASIEIFELPAQPERMLKTAMGLFRRLDEDAGRAAPGREP